MFIVFEGIDGVGKSTQVRLLKEYFASQGQAVTTSFEPTNGTYGKLLRASATRPEGRYSLEEEIGLFLQDRQEHLDTLIKPALERGEVVILDRYYYSNMAYQGARGMNPQTIKEQNEEFCLIPDLVILLTLPLEESLERIGLRDGEGDAFESRESLQKCQAIFDTLEGDFIHRVSGLGTPEAIHKRVRRLVTGLML